MHTVQSRDGTTIAFDRFGDGPPVILVDGALCYRKSGGSRKLAALLAPHFMVYAYDRRGRGDALRLFMREVGVPGIVVTLMRFMPAWSKLKAIAHTLPYDFAILDGLQTGNPLPDN